MSFGVSGNDKNGELFGIEASDVYVVAFAKKGWVFSEQGWFFD